MKQDTTSELPANKTQKNQSTQEQMNQLQAQYDEILLQKNALMSERDAVKAKLDQIVAELAASKSFSEDLMNSLSWRVTATLRYFAKFFMERSRRK